MGTLRQKVLTRRNSRSTGTRLGPSGSGGGDLLGMAGAGARVEPWQDMPETHRPVGQPTREGGHARRRDLVRALAVVLAVVALILTSSAMNWVTEASAAEPNEP